MEIGAINYVSALPTSDVPLLCSHRSIDNSTGSSISSVASIRSRQTPLEEQAAERQAKFQKSRSLFEKNVSPSKTSRTPLRSTRSTIFQKADPSSDHKLSPSASRELDMRLESRHEASPSGRRTERSQQNQWRAKTPSNETHAMHHGTMAHVTDLDFRLPSLRGMDCRAVQRTAPGSSARSLVSPRSVSPSMVYSPKLAPAKRTENRHALHEIPQRTGELQHKQHGESLETNLHQKGRDNSQKVASADASTANGTTAVTGGKTRSIAAVNNSCGASSIVSNESEGPANVPKSGTSVSTNAKQGQYSEPTSILLGNDDRARHAALQNNTNVDSTPSQVKTNPQLSLVSAPNTAPHPSTTFSRAPPTNAKPASNGTEQPGMFRSIQQASKRFTGLASAISEDDSSESGCESTGSSPTLDSSGEEKIQSKQLQSSMSSLPREHLLASCRRTLSSVQCLRELLAEQLSFHQSLLEEHEILENTIAQLVTTMSQSHVIAGHMSRQPLVNRQNVAAKVEQASEVAATYALPLAKTAIETIVAQVTTTLDSHRFTPPVSDTRPSKANARVLTEKINGKYREWREDEDADEEVVETRRGNSPKNPRNKASDGPRLPVQQGRELKGRELKSPPVFCLDVDECTTAATSLEALHATLNSARVDLSGGSYHEDDEEDVFNDIEEEEDSYGTPTHEEPMMVILEVAVTMDKSPYGGSRTTFRILATDSISDVVETFSQRFKLAENTTQSLTEFLEAEENAAATFPVKVEVALSSLV